MSILKSHLDDHILCLGLGQPSFFEKLLFKRSSVDCNRFKDRVKTRILSIKVIGDRNGEGTHLGNLGSVYGFLYQYEKATGYYTQALTIFKEIKSPRAEWVRKRIAVVESRKKS